MPSVDLRIVTYNIHRSRGMDRRVRPERIAEVLAAIDADIIALQEVSSGRVSRHRLQTWRIAAPGRRALGHCQTAHTSA